MSLCKQDAHHQEAEEENGSIVSSREGSGDLKDPLMEFVNSLQSEHQAEVMTIVSTEMLPIDKKLEYLEDHLTVGQLRTCRRLLEEQCSNFKRFLSKAQQNFVDRMISKEDFSSIKNIIVGTGDPAVMEAFQNYLKYNDLEITLDKTSKKCPRITGKDQRPPKRKEESPTEEDTSEGETEECESCQNEGEEPSEEGLDCPPLRALSRRTKDLRKGSAQSAPAVPCGPVFELWMKTAENWQKTSETLLRAAEQWAANIAKDTARRIDGLEQQIKKFEREMRDMESRNQMELNFFGEKQTKVEADLELMKKLERRIGEEKFEQPEELQEHIFDTDSS